MPSAPEIQVLVFWVWSEMRGEGRRMTDDEQTKSLSTSHHKNSHTRKANMAAADDLDAWEEQSAQVLNAIRCFIDALRSAPCPQGNAAGLPNQTQKRQSDIRIPLVDHLRSSGVFDLVHHLSDSQVCDSSTEQILHHVIFPLLTQLQACYTILDNAADSPVPQSTSSEKGNNKPLPSKGMLSLKDYTNVACLLEFAICTSLLPQMGYYSFLDEGKHIDRSKAMLLAQQRFRSLPKSLAGRISSQSLAWGMHAAADGWSQTASTTNGERQSATVDARAMILHQNCKELSQLAISVGRLVLLDRFRPMLLPRHLADLYMALLFLERCKWSLQKVIKSQTEDSSLNKLQHVGDENGIKELYSALLFTPLQMNLATHMHQSTKSTKSTDKIEVKPIDHREAALACRTLLGGEASVVMSPQSANASLQRSNNLVLMIPPWIRMRLGQCLTKLAEDDLHAVVDVFVASARSIGSESTQHDGDIMTGAAARLARVLCAKPSSDNGLNAARRFQQQLCDQFINFLVLEGEIICRKLMDGSEESKNEVLEMKLSRSCLAMVHTLCATFSQLPENVLQSYFVARLSSGLFPSDQADKSSTECFATMQSTSAIWFWLSAMPSSYYLDPSIRKKLKSVLLNNIPSTSYTHSNCTILGQALRLAAIFRQVDSESKLVVEVNSDHANNAVQLIAEMTLNQILYSLLRESADVYSIALEIVKAVAADQFDREGYTFCISHTITKASPPAPVYTRSADISQPHADVLKGVEQRGITMIDAVIAPIAAVAESMLVDNTEKGGALDRNEYLLPGALFQLVLMMHFYTSSSANDDSNMAAKVNAKLSQYGLVNLLKKDFHASRIAATVMLGLLCEKCSPASILLGTSHSQEEANADILELLAIIIECAAFQMEKSQATNNAAASLQELFSTTSIVVSLLVSLLELGSEKRSDHDENILQSMMSSLQILSISTHTQFQRPRDDNDEATALSVELAELAEMSSHAMALIVARKTDGKDSTSRQEADTSKSGIELIAEQLSFAERDLESSQPPLRAKAVVSLRHIARSLNTAGATSEIIQEVKATVCEFRQPSSRTMPEAELVARSLARICFISLSDAESYVYLASVQTLVAICDMCPNVILPLTATLVAKGTAELPILLADAKVEDVVLNLSPEQRIKAAESLIFMIRRRGDAIFLHDRLLFDLLLFGTKQHQDKSSPHQENSLNIQLQTHTYFIGEDGVTDNDLDERQVRINTGGPVFKLEEGDLLRATSISVVSELVIVLKPASVAPFCHILVKLVSDALQLDDSRPVHRAAATLARELYASIEDEVSNNDNSPLSASLAVAMASSHESLLCSIIKSGASVGYTTSNGNRCYIDAATQSRCAEAVEIRDNLESCSVFSTASFVAESLKVEDNPMVNAVKKALAR
jgi:hypothetical protein